MSYSSVNGAFSEFNSYLSCAKTERDKVASHRSSISDCLVKNFKITHFFKSGSMGNGTNINGYSDTDYFAVMPESSWDSDSSYTLGKARDCLKARFSTTDGIRVSTPAVIVPFGSNYASETTEIVLADFVKENDDGYRIYDIADGDGNWMKSSPSAHNSYVTGINKEHSYRAKPLIRFLKAWKYFRSVPISSFYLEIFTARYCDGEDSIHYSIDILRILRKLKSNGLCKIQDPLGICGYIEPCTVAQKEGALSKINTAIIRAEHAREEERNENTDEALDWWDRLYNYELLSNI